ncbi:MAG: 23S rRNA (pseudouridine(1915)-N(3))-methyltransferase RlmH [Eubacteriales bacterium]|nr:23S rRNA (pseudouridine(1915)-N(3))-methyltransferase RlmH [Eubacteriales bacterium]
MKYEIYLSDYEKNPSFYKKAIAEYEKRLGRYCGISCHFVKKEKEWKKIWESSREAIVVLPGESTLTSEAFSRRIHRWEMNGKGRLSILIPSEKEEMGEGAPAFEKLHLSRFTMNSAMAAMVLCEQIYRGYRILHNHPYHK